jgi:hypothetical protein
VRWAVKAVTSVCIESVVEIVTESHAENSDFVEIFAIATWIGDHPQRLERWVHDRGRSPCDQRQQEVPNDREVEEMIISVGTDRFMYVGEYR